MLARKSVDATNILDLYRGEPGSARHAQPGSDSRNEWRSPYACNRIYSISARGASVETFPRAVFLTGAAL